MGQTTLSGTQAHNHTIPQDPLCAPCSPLHILHEPIALGTPEQGLKMPSPQGSITGMNKVHDTSLVAIKKSAQCDTMNNTQSPKGSLALSDNLWFYTMIVLESCIFPIPPDPFFMVKGLNNIKNVWKLALICTCLSTLGGCAMYWIGAWCYDHFTTNVISMCGGQQSFLTIQHLIAKWGPLAILGKTISPIPYKLLALVSGISQLSLTIFTITSFATRGIRFFALAGLIHRYQEHAQRVSKQYQSWIRYGGYALVILGLVVMVTGFLLNW